MPWIVLFPALAAACYTDLKTRKIRNWLTVPLLVAALAWNAWWGGIPVIKTLGSGVAVAGFGLMTGMAGMGDIKLLLGVGAWLGLDRLWRFYLWFVLARLVGAVAARLRAYRWSPKAALSGMGTELVMEAQGMPYAGLERYRYPGAFAVAGAVAALFLQEVI